MCYCRELDACFRFFFFFCLNCLKIVKSSAHMANSSDKHLHIITHECIKKWGFRCIKHISYSIWVAEVEMKVFLFPLFNSLFTWFCGNKTTNIAHTQKLFRTQKGDTTQIIHAYYSCLCLRPSDTEIYLFSFFSVYPSRMHTRWPIEMLTNVFQFIELLIKTQYVKYKQHNLFDINKNITMEFCWFTINETKLRPID